MKKSLITLIVLAFGLTIGLANAAKHEAPMKDDALKAACKGKKAGDEVTVDGKKTKCPEKKSDKK